METNNLKKLLLTSVVLVTIIIIVVAVVSSQKKTKTVEPRLDPKVAVEKKNRTTSLYFSPAAQSVAAGSSMNVKVYMNTGGSTVNGVELKTTFDPNVFEITKVTKEETLNGLAQEIRNSIDNTTGMFNYSAFGLDKNLFLNGSNLFIYTLQVKVKSTAQAGTYTINFDPTSVISASGAGQDMFKDSTPHTVTVTAR